MRNVSGIKQISNWFAGSIAMVVIILIPLVFIALEIRNVKGSLNSEVIINSRFISNLINANPEMWQYEKMRFEEILSRRPQSEEKEIRRILDNRNNVIAESADDLSPPLLKMSQDLKESGVTVGKIEIYRSWRPLLWYAFYIFIVGMLIATMIFIAIRILPFRALIRAEEALRENEEMFRAFFEQASIGIAEVDTKTGRFIRINQKYCDIAGYTLDEMMAMTYLQITHPDDLQADMNNVRKIGEGKIRVYSREKRYVRKDGAIVWVNLTVSPIWEKEEQSSHQIAVVEDITERKRSEETIRFQKVYFESLFQNLPDGVVSFDGDGHIIEINKSFTEMFGYTPAEVKGTDISELVAPPERSEETQEIRKRILKGESVQIETVRKRKDGSMLDVLLQSAAVSVDTRLVQHILIYRDISERKKYEADLVAARRQAEAANRAKSEFLANMSHEIRTPMNGIIGMTELALDTDLTKDQRDYLEMVRTSADSLLDLINDILDFSKIESKKLELEEIDFDLGNTLENTADILAVRAREKGLELTCHIMPEVPTALVGDPGRLRQILINLAGNATKFTEKGEIGIKVELLENDPDTVMLKFSVKDTGIGIAPDKFKMIFDNFSQVDGSITRKYGGTGLGLTISRELVKLMGGDIRVESEVGRGSTFYFTARFRKGKSIPLGFARLSLMDIAGMPILIIDDNATNRQIFREMTAQWGLVPTEAAGGPEGLALMAEAFQAGHPYQMVLLDLQMPGMDGFSVAKAIKNSAFGKQVKIIMLTSMGQKGDTAHCREIGISGYLMKPVKKADLLDAIKIALGRTDACEPEDVVTCYTVQEARKTFTILLAEDNLINQKLAVSLLENRGHQVVLAQNGKEAVEIHAAGNFDLILMDIQMPELDGFEATRQIREKEATGKKHIPIAAMTAHAMKGDREKCLAAGMDGYISKPIKAAELFTVIEKMMNQFPGDSDKNLSQLKETEETQTPEIFDLAAALEVVIGNRALFYEIGKLFIDTLPGYLDQIRSGIRNKDAQAVERAAHSLKGSVGNFGARRSYEAALKLEKLGGAGNLTAIPAAMNLLEEELGLLLDELKRVLAEEDKK